MKWDRCSTASHPQCKSGPDSNVELESKMKPLTSRLSLHRRHCRAGGRAASFSPLVQRCDNLSLVCSSCCRAPRPPKFVQLETKTCKNAYPQPLIQKHPRTIQARTKQFYKCACVYNRPPWSILNFRLSGPLDPAPRFPPHTPDSMLDPSLFFGFGSGRPPSRRVNLESGGRGGEGLRIKI